MLDLDTNGLTLVSNKTYFTSLLSGAVEVFSESAMNKILCMDSEAVRYLALLEGCLLSFEFNREPRFFLRVHKGRVKLIRQAPGLPDLTVQMREIRSREVFGRFRITSFFDSLVGEIEGETTKVTALRKLFSNFTPDIEEGLSQIIGDTLAQKAGQGLRSTKSWSKDTGSLMANNFLEYIVEERKIFPTRAQTKRYFDEISRLETAVGALESRLFLLDCFKE